MRHTIYPYILYGELCNVSLYAELRKNGRMKHITIVKSNHDSRVIYRNATSAREPHSVYA